MDFEAPIPFSDALDWIARKLVTPTAASSAEIASTWSKVARKMSLYSARNTCAECLEDFRTPLQDFIDGKINEATARQLMQAGVDHYGYQPESGFPGHAGQVPPADQDSLRDLSSDRRIKLVIETGARLAANTAYQTAATEPDRLYRYPAYEFGRIYLKAHPRGESGKESDPSWRVRWVRAGFALPGGKMIARKDADWGRLSDNAVFPDGTDAVVPPLAWNSGYGWLREVPRAECLALGMDLSDLAPQRPSLLGDFFDGHPERATLADLKSSRQDILEALAELRRAA